MATEQSDSLMDESATLIGELIQLQNEVVYVVECLAQDHSGAAKRGIWDVEGFLNKTGLPGYIDGPVRAQLAEAEKSVGLANRNLGRCARLMQEIRCRVANELAWRTGQSLPYGTDGFPPYSPDYDSRASLS